MNPLKLSIIILFLITAFSCTKSVDFDQIDDVEISPSYLITLVYFELYAPDFLDSGNIEEPFQADVVEASIVDVPEKYVEKVEFTFITDNYFSRDFNVEIVFFDRDKNPIYKLSTILIPANSNELTTIIEIPTEDIAVVFETAYYGFLLELVPSEDGTIILPNDASNLEFKSSLHIFLNYKNI